MPITYQIDKARQLIRTRCVGNVTFQEVMEHFQTLKSDPECPTRLDVLLDLTEMSSVPDPDQLRSVSSQIGDMVDKVRFDACAIVTSSDLLFGMSRMFVVFAEQGFRASSVFRRTDEAERWLTSQQSDNADKTP